MGLTLHLGVDDVAYGAADGTETTYTVAMILEAKYGLFTAFYTHYKDQIGKLISDDLADQIQRMVNGYGAASGRATLTYGADEKIVALFRKFILAEEHSIVVAASALQGSRFKSPTAKGAGKPAFVDTGLLLSTLRAWTARDGSR